MAATVAAAAAVKARGRRSRGRHRPMSLGTGKASEVYVGQDPNKRYLTRRFMEDLMEEANYRCENPFNNCPLFWCDFKLQKGGSAKQNLGGLLVDFDHRTPWSQGGRSTYDNVQVLCPTCHANKTRNFDGAHVHAHQWVDSQGVWRTRS